LARDSFSDAYLAVALAVSATALGLAALLIVSIALLRAHRRWREARLARHERRWREALHLATETPGADLEPVPRGLVADFASYWNRVRATVKGEAADNVAALLQRHGLEARVAAMLEGRSLRLRLVAATTLGYLRLRAAWEPLARLALDPSPVLSFTAAQALLRIAPDEALDLLAADIVARDDWSLARLGGLFRELGPDPITPGLARIIASKPGQGAHRIVKLARFGQRARMGAAVREWLRSSDDPEVLAAALDYVEMQDDLPRVRGAARHGDWRVRMSAARALGRIGARPELALLLELLRDPHWWVRYHAAHAIAGLHGLDGAEVESLQRQAADPLASGMLAHVLADRGPAA
jgi:hypothetical protein